MKKSNTYTAVKAAFLFALLLVLTNSSFAQTETKKDGVSSAAPSTNTQTVNAQQSGAWTVGIDAAKNAVKLVSSDADPVTVRLVGTGPARKPYQARLAAGVETGSISGNAYLPIPAGKRLVIENISAIARSAPGTRMVMNLYSYYDNGDGVGDQSDITFHRIALIDQGTFDSLATATANHHVLILADEQIGTAHFGVTLQVRMDSPASGGTNQAQVTLSGYLEDLPTP